MSSVQCRLGDLPQQRLEFLWSRKFIDDDIKRHHDNSVKITCDPVKRARTLEERGLDFLDAAEVFEGPVYEVEDDRFDYGECRVLCFGLLRGRMVVVGYVERDGSRHVFTMRKANEREQARFGERLG